MIMGTNFFTNEKENTLLEKIEGVFKYKRYISLMRLLGISELPDILESGSLYSKLRISESW